MKPDGNIFHGLGKRCAACKRREPPLFGGGGTTGWPRATVGCGLSSWAHYASSTSATRPRASSPARCDCVIKQSPNPRGTICRASPSPSPSVVLPYSSECVGHVCTCVYIRARDCTYVKIDLSSSFLSLPSFLPFSLPVFNFFNSATQGGGKLISITKHDRLVCTGFLSGIYGVRFLKEKETDRRIFHELVSPPQNRKERNIRNPHLIELDFWIHRQGFFFYKLWSVPLERKRGRGKKRKRGKIESPRLESSRLRRNNRLSSYFLNVRGQTKARSPGGNFRLKFYRSGGGIPWNVIRSLNSGGEGRVIERSGIVARLIGSLCVTRNIRCFIPNESEWNSFPFGKLSLREREKETERKKKRKEPYPETISRHRDWRK